MDEVGNSLPKMKEENEVVTMDTGNKEIRYAADKPSDCRICYWWRKDGGHCVLGEGKCYYILPKPKKKPKSECDGCPYGKAKPCVGYCLRRIMNKDYGGQGDGICR